MNSRLFLALAAVLALVLPARADHDSIDEAFTKVAPEILAKVRARNGKNVGVLKLLVQRGESKPDDAVGELNMGLADRLEAALILASPDEKIGIIHRASMAVVENMNRAANHCTPDGRKKLFRDMYPLAWGTKTVPASAFVTGVASISKDLRKVTIRLEMFGDDGVVERIGEPIDLPTTRRTLVEAGYSYVLTEKAAPSVFDGARGGLKNKGSALRLKAEDDVAALDQALAMNDPTKTEGVKFTAAAAVKDCPVKLTIRYNDKDIEVEGDQVPEPKENEKVTFLLKNTDPAFMYAVVLKVNGKNTLFSEDSEPAQCLKWIIPPNGSVEVTGFQESDADAIPFKILSTKESQENVVRYGDLGGTVRMVAYRGKQVDTDPSAVEKKEPDHNRVYLAAVSRGSKELKKGDIKPQSLRSLKGDLLGREEQLEGQRGYIDKGARKVANPIDRIFFEPLPTVGVA